MQTATMPTTVQAPWWRAAIPEWLPIAIGLFVLYAPTFYDLFTGLWSTEEQAHGPIIFGLALWLIYRNWPLMIAQGAGKSSPALGWTLCLLGLVLYILGRSQQFSIFEIGSLIVILAAIVLIKCGRSGLRVMWFPLFFMLFMIPLPGLFVAILTLPMKTAVSYVTEHVLYFVGYPISRTGVILQIGQYQLMVADACAGLHTLLTLEALGLFYLNLVRHTSAIRNIVLAVMIVPISFTANVIRVMTLTLITYHFGDAAGQGFLHGFAGMLLFLSALLLIIGLDAVLHTVARKFGGKNA